MKLFILPFLLLSILSFGQVNSIALIKPTTLTPATMQVVNHSPGPGVEDIHIDRTKRWRLDKNRIFIGGLIFLSGAAKGFNEGLQFNYFGFEDIFPKANDQWFYPAFSFKNKYKDGDPSKGPKFPLSTSVLVMFTDQYHLNNFINRAAITAALVIKIGEGKKPLRQYLFDVAYYTACYQLGFHSIYSPIKARSH